METGPVGAIADGAARVESRRAALHHAYDTRDGSEAADDEWRNAAAAFRLAVTAFYEPYDAVVAGVRAKRLDAIEAATAFLVVDPWCVRSGYLKAKLMHALANVDLPRQVIAPLRNVVLRRIEEPQPHLVRFASQLAANVWDADFQAEIDRRATVGLAGERLAAQRVAAGARYRLQSLAGRPAAGRD